MTRPTVSVIVPFAGTPAELDALVARLTALERRPGDQVLVADNRPTPAAGRGGAVDVVDASGPRSPAYARNVGARSAAGEWLVFVDADTEPQPGLLDCYFEPLPDERVGILGGGVEDRAERPTLVARYVAARRMMDQSTTLVHRHRPFVQTANCAVRRAAFEAVGGFTEVRAGEDADLCWRLVDAGWRLELRERARVAHRARASLRALLGQLLVHGAGAAWLDTYHPGADPPPTLRNLLGRLRHYPLRAFSELRAGRRTEAAFVLIDLLALYAYDLGRLRSNAAR
jgi:mycofactocin glycosyltransferase